MRNDSPESAPAAADRPGDLAWATPHHAQLLWESAVERGTPLVRRHPTRPDRRLATFVWRSDEPLAAVYVRINRVTDKAAVTRGLMSEVPGTGIWIRTVTLPAALRAGYAICPVPMGPEAAASLDGLGSRGASLPFLPDPLSRGAQIDVGRGPRHCVLAMDEAPAQPEWEPVGPPVPRGAVETTTSPFPVAGVRRPLWTYLPPGDQSGPLALVVLLDAEVWFGGLDVGTALDRAIAAGRIPPVAVVGVANLDNADRVRILSPDSGLLDDPRSAVVPWVRDRHPRAWAGRAGTVLCGQSLGGLTALAAAVRAPDTFGLLLAHSPSLWWRPDHSTRPADLTSIERPWITERLCASPPPDVRVRCDVGTLEGASVPHLRTLTDRLTARGWPAELATYVGGHDFACWRGALLDGLATLAARTSAP